MLLRQVLRSFGLVLLYVEAQLYLWDGSCDAQSPYVGILWTWNKSYLIRLNVFVTNDSLLHVRRALRLAWRQAGGHVMHPTLEPVCAIGRACKRSTRVIRDPPSTQISPAHLLAFNEVDCCSWGQSCMKPPSSRRRLPPMHNALHRMECGSCYGISLRMDEQMIFERHHECEWTRLLVCAEETQVAPELPTEVGIVFTGMLTQSRTATIALHK